MIHPSRGATSHTRGTQGVARVSARFGACPEAVVSDGRSHVTYLPCPIDVR